MSKIINENISIQTFKDQFDGSNQATKIKIPNYQRNYVWKLNQQRYLIETILLNFAIPPAIFHTKDEDNGVKTHEVVDGQQRLTTVYLFLTDKFKMQWSIKTKEYFKDNEDICDLIEKTDKLLYSELPEDIKNKIMNYKINYWDLDKNLSADDVKEMFVRMNDNSVKLNRHEIRVASFMSQYLLSIPTDYEFEIESFLEQNVISELQKSRKVGEELILYILSYTESGNISEMPNDLDLFAKRMIEFDEKYYEDLCGKVKEVIGITLQVNDSIKEEWYKGKTYFFSLYSVVLEMTREGMSKKEILSKFKGFTLNANEDEKPILLHSKSSSFKKEMKKMIFDSIEG